MDGDKLEMGPVAEAPTVMRLRAKMAEHRGLLATFIATFCFAGQAICVRLLKGNVPTVEVVCLRFLLQGIFSLVFGLFFGAPMLVKSAREAVLLLGRGIAGTFAIGLLYFSLINMSAGLANAIVFGAPAFVGLFAWIFVKEAFNYRDIILVIVNFAGIILIAQPPFLFKSEELDNAKKMELIAVASAIGAMLFNAGTFIFVRLLGLMKTNAVTIVFYYAICGTIVPGIGGLIMQNWVVPPCGKTRHLLVLIGLLNFLAQALVSYGLACTKKSYFVAVVNSNQVPVTIILEILIIQEVPNWISFAGTALVVVSALGVVFREGSMATKQDGRNDTNRAPE